MYLILAYRDDEPALFCLLIEARRYSLQCNIIFESLTRDKTWQKISKLFEA